MKRAREKVRLREAGLVRQQPESLAASKCWSLPSCSRSYVDPMTTDQNRWGKAAESADAVSRVLAKTDTLNATNDFWRVHGTYERVKAQPYLYRAVNSSAVAVAFLLSAVVSVCALGKRAKSSSSEAQPTLCARIR